jgi:hypothetical protein
MDGVNPSVTWIRNVICELGIGSKRIREFDSESIRGPDVNSEFDTDLMFGNHATQCVNLNQAATQYADFRGLGIRLR